MNDKERLERIKQMQKDGLTIWDMGENDLVWLIEQAEQAEGLKVKAKKLKEEKQKFMSSATKQRKQKQHYRNLLESIRYTPEIAKEIQQENPDKKVIDANDLLQHMLRKINAELEGESE